MSIVKICRKCGGSGNKLVSVKPIRFTRCNKCSGRGGRTANLAAILSIFAATAAHAEPAQCWGHGKSCVTLRPSEAPGAVAEVTFANAEVFIANTERFDLSLGGFAVGVVINNLAGKQPDTMTVTPPEGYIAVPPSVTVAEGETRVITIYSSEGAGA
jgi:hypothetical protein